MQQPWTIGLATPSNLQDFSCYVSVVNQKIVHHQPRWTDGSDGRAKHWCLRHRRSWMNLLPPVLRSINISCSCLRYFRVKFLAIIEGRDETNVCVSSTTFALSETVSTLIESGMC